MNCFNHPDKPAVGLCKSCGKGLCKDCLTEVSHGLACANACEDRVNLINRIIENNQRVISAANVQVRSSGMFILIMGVVFCLMGFLPLLTTGDAGALPMGILGVCFLAYGLIRIFKRSQQYPAAE